MVSGSERETEELAALLAHDLQKGDNLWLYGDLGAGKTAFVRGLARGLGIHARVTSPTFALVNEYEGSLPLFHFDLYRLSGPEELWELGWDDYQERGVCAAEWSERMGATPPGYVVRLEKRGDEAREICIVRPDGSLWEA